MFHRLIIFPTPLDARCEMKHDALGGIVTIAIDATHSSGRSGQSFLIPEGTPSGHGARLYISAPGKIPLDVKGILHLREDGFAYLEVDDFTLQDKVSALPFPTPVSPEVRTPVEVIHSIFSSGKFNLSTKEGCGKFTEACVESLHGRLSNKYGHVRKSGAQNMYNGHAVDALMLLEKNQDTQPGIYDIILDTESPDARPQFILKGPPVPELWYYPAS